MSDLETSVDLVPEVFHSINSLIDEVELLQNVASASLELNDNLPSLLARISEKLLMWRHDLCQNTLSLKSSRFSAELILGYVKKTQEALLVLNQELRSARQLLTESKSDNTDTDVRFARKTLPTAANSQHMLIQAVREYNSAVRRVITLRRPPFDEKTLHHLQEYDEFLPGIIENELQILNEFRKFVFYILQAAFFRIRTHSNEDQSAMGANLVSMWPASPWVASGTTTSDEPPEPFINFEDLPQGSKIIISSKESSHVSIPILETAPSHETPPVQAAYLQTMETIMAEVLPVVSVGHGNLLNIQSTSSRDFIDLLIEIARADSYKTRTNILDLSYHHLYRLDAAMEHVSAASTQYDTRKASEILWMVFTVLLKATKNHPDSMFLTTSLFEALVLYLPKMRWYSEMCTSFEEYGLSIYVVQLFERVVRFGVRGVEALRTLNFAQSSNANFKEVISNLDLDHLAGEIKEKSVEVDKAALKERFAVGADMDSNPKHILSSSIPSSVDSPNNEPETKAESWEAFYTAIKDKEQQNQRENHEEDDREDDEEDITEVELYRLLKETEDPSPLSEPGPQPIHDAPISLLDFHSFRGRRNELVRLVDATFAQFGAYTGRCILYHPEQAGKTQILLRFLRSLCATTPEVSVFWITASSVAGINRSYEQILALLQDRARNSINPQHRMFAVKRHLERLDLKYGKSWILVLDGIQDEGLELLRRFIPRVTPRGRIIYTTRSLSVVATLEADPGAPLHRIDVEDLSSDDATNVLLASASLEITHSNVGWAKQVAAWLEYSPLPISILDGLIKRFRKDFRIDTIFDLCQNELKQHRMLDIAGHLRQKPPVQAVLRVGLRKLRENEADVYTLLRILAFFDPESIPFGPLAHEEFFDDDEVPSGSDTRKSICEIQSSLAPGIDLADYVSTNSRGTPYGYETPLESSTVFFSQINPNSVLLSPDTNISEALRKLSQRASRQELCEKLLACSFVTKRSNVARLTLHIHETIREVILAELKEERDFDQFYYVSVWLLTQALDQLGPSLLGTNTWRRCAIFLPHFESLKKMKPAEHETNESLVKAFSKLGEYLYASGQYEKAIQYFQWCKEDLNEEESYEVSEKLARSHQKVEDFETADNIFGMLLSRQEDLSVILSDDNLSVAEGLASNYYLRGWLCKARDLYHEILNHMEERNLTDLYLKAKIHEGIANTFQRLGEPLPASRYYDKCFDYHKKRSESQTISKLRIRYNKARLLRDQGKLAEAQADFESILEDYARTVGREHPDALLVSGRLAFTYAMRGQYELAEQLALRNLSAQLAKEDRQWRAICYIHWVLAGIYTHTETGKRRKAHAHFLLALEGYETHLGAGHELTLYVRRDFSHIFQLQSRLKEAIEILEEVDSKLIRGTAAAAKLARLYDWRATAAKKDGRFEDWRQLISRAEALAKSTLEIQEEELGKYHPDFNYTLWVLARIYSNRGYPEDRKRAEILYKNALKGYERIKGEVFDSLKTLQQEYEKFQIGHLLTSPKPIMGRDSWLSSLEMPFGMLADRIDEDYREGGQYNDISNVFDAYQSPVDTKSPINILIPTGTTMFNQPLATPIKVI